jgi:acyl carrier protein
MASAAQMSDIARDVIAQIAVVLREDPQHITPTARLAQDLGADSLDSVTLVMAIEDRFAIDMPDEEVEPLRTVQELIEYVELAVAMKQGEVNGHRIGASRYLPADG